MKLTKQRKLDLIIAYEGGELDDKGCLELFAHLIKTGQCWSLQGHYGRTARDLIENQVIDRKGKILVEV